MDSHYLLTSNNKRKRKGADLNHKDRFLPNRSLSMESFLDENDKNAANLSPHSKEYNKLAKETLGMKKTRVLSFFSEKPEPKYDPSVLPKRFKSTAKRVRSSDFRHIPRDPVRVLDAPDICNDYYLNLVHWSPSNVLSVALHNSLYLWNGDTAETNELCSVEDFDPFSCVRFNEHSDNLLFLGTDSGEGSLFDVTLGKKIRSISGHGERIAAADWHEHILACGGRNGDVVFHDVRQKNDVVRRLQNHIDEVCSLSFNEGGDLLASGGNDNKVSVFDVRKSEELHSFQEHEAAVKGLCWNPRRRHVLATGGGRLDRTLKQWSAVSGRLLSSTCLDGAISGIHFSDFSEEVVASVGKNLNLYSTSDMKLCKQLSGHTAKLHGLVLSPCGTTVCTYGGDEALRFWKVFQAPEKKKIVTPEYARQKFR